MWTPIFTRNITYIGGAVLVILYSVLDMVPYFDPQKPTGNIRYCRNLPEMTTTADTLPEMTETNMKHVASLFTTQLFLIQQKPPNIHHPVTMRIYAAFSETPPFYEEIGAPHDNLRKPLKLNGNRKNNTIRHNRIEYIYVVLCLVPLLYLVPPP